MENSYFIYTDSHNQVILERFHMCTWEFSDNSSLVEFGLEISKESINSSTLVIELSIPWVNKNCDLRDLYDRLSIPDNSRFIFNDSVMSTYSLDGGRNRVGVIQKFNSRNDLCILPASLNINDANTIFITLNLQPYIEYQSDSKPNIYIRFSIKPSIPYISIRKNGLNKSTIIYDVKVNERRNIPDDKVSFFINKSLCDIKNCFSFNILPNKYDIIFFDSSTLKNVRTLEYESFNKYLGDSRVKKDELIVVFNKKQNHESFSFFSIYAMERIGIGQFALAILINILCGILLFIPTYRTSINKKLSFFQIWGRLPFEIYFALIIVIATLIYFLWPTIKNYFKKWSIIFSLI